MPFNCSQAPAGSVCDSSNVEMSKFRVQTGKTYKLRLINSGAGSILDFSIDGHELTIVSNDFVTIEPYNTTVVTLGVSKLISSINLSLTNCHIGWTTIGSTFHTKRNWCSVDALERVWSALLATCHRSGRHCSGHHTS